MRKADNLPLSCAVVTKSWNLNFLEPSGPIWACNGTATQFCYRLSRWVEPRFIARRRVYIMTPSEIEPATIRSAINCLNQLHHRVPLFREGHTSYFAFRYEISWSALLMILFNVLSRSRLPRSLRHVSAVSRLLGLQVRIPPVAWMSVCCECCVSSGRGLCDDLIARPEVSYRVSSISAWY